MEAAFANTIVSTYLDGRSAKLWLDRDGRYRGEGPSGDASSGRWKAEGSRLCLTQARPVPVPLSYCTALVDVAVGSIWSTRSIFGEPLVVRLVSGR